MKTAEIDMDKKIMVCDKCFCASCWQGILMCQEAKSAGTIEIPISLLHKMGLESSHYWEDQS